MMGSHGGQIRASQRTLCFFCSFWHDTRHDLIRQRPDLGLRYLHPWRVSAQTSEAAAASSRENGGARWASRHAAAAAAVADTTEEQQPPPNSVRKNFPREAHNGSDVGSRSPYRDDKRILQPRPPDPKARVRPLQSGQQQPDFSKRRVYREQPPQQTEWNPLRDIGKKPPQQTGWNPLRGFQDKPPQRTGWNALQNVQDMPTRWSPLQKVEDKPPQQTGRDPLRDIKDKPPQRTGWNAIQNIQDKPTRWGPLQKVEDKPPQQTGWNPLRDIKDKPPQRTGWNALQNVQDMPTRWSPPQNVQDKPPQQTRWNPLQDVENEEPRRRFRPTQSLPRDDTPPPFMRFRPKPPEYNEYEGSTRVDAFEMPQRLPVQREAPGQRPESRPKSANERPRDKKARGQGRAKARESSRRHEKYKLDGEEEVEEDPDRARERRREQRKLEKAARKATLPPTPVLIPDFISLSGLAALLKVRLEEFMVKLGELGFDKLNHDHIFDAETASLVATEYHHEPILEKHAMEEDLHARPEPEDRSMLPTRPPVVTIMGHVDHGKTTLLDHLRKSSVAASEHGGITQHIGAFSVTMPSGKVITFLDTPGHEAFLNMRQRGANVTDIVILVVAADDSVKPQTLEAIKHAKAAKVPMIVAINKVDKPEANVEKVKQDLARHGVEVEEYGGDTQVVCVSGKTGAGMMELEEAVIMLSEILDVRATPDGPCEGRVLETTTRPEGRVATVLVRRGTFEPGRVVVAGSTWARIRSLRNEGGFEVASAGPGMPVEVAGWKDQPSAGDEVLQAPNEVTAKKVVEFRAERAEKLKMAADVQALNEARRLEQEKRNQTRELTAKLRPETGSWAQAKVQAQAQVVAEAEAAAEQSDETEEVEVHEELFLVKADVSGSTEAVRDSITGLGNERVRSRVLRASVGAVTESDVELAAAARAHILTFNLGAVEPSIARLAAAHGVSLHEHRIIYHLTDEVKSILSDRLAPRITQHVVGEAEVAEIFEITVKGRVRRKIAGCKIRNGTIQRSSRVRVLRGKDIIYDGLFSSLRSGKKDVTEMRKGNECGMGFADDWQAFEVGDRVQTYEEKRERRVL